MHIDTLSEPEQRVLGCLIEKRFTTPDQYPLSLNALRLACNQSTNRDPVVDYDEDTVRNAAQNMARYGLTRLASGHSSRATKYRHLADETLALNKEQLAVLAVLLLRGPQTPGELKARTERMVAWNALGEVDLVLGQLIERSYVQRLERRPGQKEERFQHVLGEGGHAETAAPVGSPAAVAAAPNAPAAMSAAPVAGHAAPMAGLPQGPAGADQGPVDYRPQLQARIDALEARVDELALAISELLSR